MNNKTDLFFIVLFIIVVSIIIGLNIVSLIDKKISNISVNIPPISVPKPEITILVKDNMDPNLINVKYNSNPKNDSEKEDKVEKEKIENFIVSDAQEIGNYKELKEEYVRKPDNFAKEKLDKDKCALSDDDKKFTMQVTNNDPEEKETKERLDKAYITANDFGWEYPGNYVSCANSSIADKYKTGKKSLKPSQISCAAPNKLTAENYYKTHFKRQVIPIEDYHVRGYNYGDFTDYPTPYATRDMRILSQNTKGLPKNETKSKHIPTGYNYAFHNTPAMPMP